MESERAIMTFPKPFKISVVVRDIDSTVQFMSPIWGLETWNRFEYSPKQAEIVVGELFSLKVASANLGPLELELIQPQKGRSFWSQFLKTKGEGLCAIAYNVSDYDEIVSQFQSRGSRMIVSAAFQGKRWCYFDTRPGGQIVELQEI